MILELGYTWPGPRWGIQYEALLSWYSKYIE